MDLIPKFKINQRVYCVRVNWSERKVQCPDCLGTREWTVHLPSGEVFQHDCPTCRFGYESRGLVSDWDDHVHMRELTIGSVQTDTAREDAPIRYMCLETGVGTGSVYDEKEMFGTLDEAKAYGELELARVKGLRQQEELARRKVKKKDSLIHGKRKTNAPSGGK